MSNRFYIIAFSFNLKDWHPFWRENEFNNFKYNILSIGDISVSKMFQVISPRQNFSSILSVLSWLYVVHVGKVFVVCFFLASIFHERDIPLWLYDITSSFMFCLNYMVLIKLGIICLRNFNKKILHTDTLSIQRTNST